MSDKAGLGHNAAEVKAIATATDNPLLLEKMTTENEVTRLNILRNAWQNERLLLERSIERDYPKKIRGLEARIAEIKQDIETVKAHPAKGDLFRITLDGREYIERAKAGKVLTIHMKMLEQQFDKTYDVAETVIGSFCGMELSISASWKIPILAATGAGSYFVELGDSEVGNITRLENLLNGLRSKQTEYEAKRDEMETQLESAKKQVGQPFIYEKELNENSQRLMEINTKLEFKELADQDAVLEEEQDGGETTVISVLDPVMTR